MFQKWTAVTCTLWILFISRFCSQKEEKMNTKQNCRRKKKCKEKKERHSKGSAFDGRSFRLKISFPLVHYKADSLTSVRKKQPLQNKER